MATDLKEKVKNLKETRFFAVFFSTAFNKIINLIYGIVLVRIISKAEYGIYSYSNNIFSYFNGLIGMGMASTVLQVCSEAGDSVLKRGRFNFCFYVALIFNVILSISIVVFSLLFKLPIDGSNSLLLLMFGLPITACINLMFFNWLRANMDNLGYSILTSINTVLILVFAIVGSLLYNAIGLIIGRYIAAISTTIIALIFFKCYLPPIRKKKEYVIIERNDKIRTIKIGLSLCLSEFLSIIIPLLGVTILGTITISEEAVASYKAATTIPTALGFIGTAVITYAYSYFVRKKDDKIWTYKHYSLILAGLTIISSGVAVFSLFFSKEIMTIVFGGEYIDGSMPFSILMIGFIFNTVLRIPATNLLVTQTKLKFTIFISAFSSILLIVLNLLLVPKYNSIGAAYSQTVTMLITGLIATLYYFFVIFKIKNKEINNDVEV